MKKLQTILILCFFVQIGIAQSNLKLSNWHVTVDNKLNMPLFASQPDVDGNKFEMVDLLKNTVVDFDSKNYRWEKVNITEDSLMNIEIQDNQLLIFRGYLSVDRWMKGNLQLNINNICEIYVDGKLVKTKKNDDLNIFEVPLKLKSGKHIVNIKTIAKEKPFKFFAGFIADSNFSDGVAHWGLEPERYMTVNDVLDGKSVRAANISASGRYVLLNYNEVVSGTGKSKQWYKLVDVKNGSSVQILRQPQIGMVKWLPSTDRISYITWFNGKTDLYVLNPENGKEECVATAISDMAGYSWSKQEDFIIYTRKKDAKKPGNLKRIYGNDDRLPYFRTRYYLYKLEVATGCQTPLTAGVYSAALHDIHPDGSKILFSTSKMDYREEPFSKQNMYEMELGSFKIDTLWKDKLYSGSCQYSPDGKKLLVQGGPECFGNIGVKVSEGRIPNSYDNQLYLFDLKTEKVSPLTRDFDPAISNACWADENKIYMSVVERDYQKLYELNLEKVKFKEINLSVDVLRSIDYSANGEMAVYTGSSITTPQQVYVLQVKKGKDYIIDTSEKEEFKNVVFGKTEDWNFVNSKGTTIYGRVYYPPNYQKGKKYPLIVNFYGGTAPTDRAFGGRYPKNIWAAHGYIVYILQPSGATGFGQDFSALHVNGYGKDAIDDIIEGTEKFLKIHTDVDVDNVGCIGASYGGFTTMMLQTRTDIFKTAIAHAGISSVTSYWGEGYWGYTYNAGAAKYSYPWNRKDIFVENSPLYNADKFNNSILLLHGTADTNVPVGESLQYYAALKILGKDVEMVLVDGENHWIIDYNKRIEWHNTIMAWFNMKLKAQPQQWNNLYPDKEI